MKLKLAGMLILVGAAAVACKTTTIDDSLGGSGGTGSTTSSTKATSTSSKATATSTGSTTMSTGTMMLDCDTGEAGDAGKPDTDPQGKICSDCVNCAVGGNCADQLSTFQNDPNAQAWLSCEFPDQQTGMGGCPQDDPSTPNVDEFQQCAMVCDSMYQSAADAYNAVLSCAICQECPTNCNAAMYCM